MQHTAHHHTPLKTEGFAHPKRNVHLFGVEPGMAIADFGSGSGAYALEMAARLANSGHVYAIDVQNDLLRRLKNEAHKRGYKNVEVIWGDLEEARGSKIADRHIDLVLMSNILFQVPEKAPLFKEASRILKRTGKLVVIDWSDPALSRKSQSRIGPHQDQVISKESAVALAESAGFEMQKEFNAGAHHYGLIFRIQ